MTKGNFTDLLCWMDNLITSKIWGTTDMLISTRPKQCNSSTASHCNHCARFSNTRNDHKIGTQIHAQDFQFTSHSPNVLFVAFEDTNLCFDILKLYLCGFFFMKTMSKSHRNSDILVKKNDYTQPEHRKFSGFVWFLRNWRWGTWFMIVGYHALQILDGKIRVETCFMVVKYMMHRKFNIFKELPIF